MLDMGIPRMVGLLLPKEADVDDVMMMREWARKGAEAQIAQAKAVLAMLDEGAEIAAVAPPVRQRTVAAPVAAVHDAPKRKMSRAAKRAVSERMKRMWAERRAAK